MNKIMVLVFILVIILINNISASCQEGQIDINTASTEELDELYGIGVVKAEAIINARPFDSVDDLIDVYGIGEITLNKIKDQGLACVEEEIENKENESLEDKEEKNDQVKENPDNINDSEGGEGKDDKINQNEDPEPPTPEIIALTPQTIKTQDEKRILNKSTLFMWGFVVFGILIGILFLLKKQKYKENEFG